MSSLRRPGTVDYSKWDNLEVSDDDDEDSKDDDDGVNELGVPPPSWLLNQGHDHDSEEEEETDDDEPLPPVRRRRRRPNVPPTASAAAAAAAVEAPSLATLQKAWNSTSTGEEDGGGDNGRRMVVAGSAAAAATTSANSNNNNKSNTRRVCAACASPGPGLRRCSRCQLVWFCNTACQRAYHPIHKKECINAAEHFQYWGFLKSSSSPAATATTNTTTTSTATSTLTPQQRRQALENALAARMALRRRRALKQAAAAAAVERARLARETRGQPTKGGSNGKNGMKQPAEKEETCSVCQCEFTVAGDAGAGLCCPSSHYMCNECAGVYCNSVLADLHASYPPSCPMCRAAMPLHHFEAQLTTQQLAAVKTYAAEMALRPGQVLAKCRHCDHFEVEQAPGSVVWWCDACGHGTCFVCHSNLPRHAIKYNLETSPHAICSQLRGVKRAVERAIEDGSQMPCPGCGLAGRKDDACTHMNCPKCATEWCYVCGLSVVAADKARPTEPDRPVNDIYLHNRDWEVNEKRCPMYLTSILDVDLNWLGEDWESRMESDEDFADDEKCLDYFHRFRTIQMLQQVLQEVGHADFQAVFENFESIRNAGYSLEEVLTTCTDHLIDREDYIRQRQEEDDDDDEDTEDEDDDDDETGDEEDDDDDEEFEEVPEEMTRAVLQEEEQMRQAIQASLGGGETTAGATTGPAQDGEQQRHDHHADNSSEEEEFEEVPEEMTTAVVREEENMRHAIAASRASAQEDDHLRRVLAESSMTTTDGE